MDNLVIAHFVGAGLAFVLGTAYAWMQCYISYVLLMYCCSRPMFYFRVIVSSITTIFLIGSILDIFYKDGRFGSQRELIDTLP